MDSLVDPAIADGSVLLKATTASGTSHGRRELTSASWHLRLGIHDSIDGHLTLGRLVV